MHSANFSYAFGDFTLGIRSKIRDALDPGSKDPVWSGFTCFAAIAQCMPHDVATVGYKVPNE